MVFPSKQHVSLIRERAEAIHRECSKSAIANNSLSDRVKRDLLNLLDDEFIKQNLELLRDQIARYATNKEEIEEKVLQDLKYCETFFRSQNNNMINQRLDELEYLDISTSYQDVIAVPNLTQYRHECIVHNISVLDNVMSLYISQKETNVFRMLSAMTQAKNVMREIFISIAIWEKTEREFQEKMEILRYIDAFISPNDQKSGYELPMVELLNVMKTCTYFIESFISTEKLMYVSPKNIEFAYNRKQLSISINNEKKVLFSGSRAKLLYKVLVDPYIQTEVDDLACVEMASKAIYDKISDHFRAANIRIAMDTRFGIHDFFVIEGYSITVNPIYRSLLSEKIDDPKINKNSKKSRS